MNVLSQNATTAPQPRVDIIMNGMDRDTIAITYGVEWQFLIPTLTKDQQDPHPNDSREVIVCPDNDHFTVAKAVRGAVLATLSNVQVQAEGLPIFQRNVATSTVPQKDPSTPPYSRFVVEIDQDLVPHPDKFPGSYTWVGVKVKSNIRNTNLPDHFDQIGHVSIALRNTLRVRLAPTTSFMVHIGEERRCSQEYNSGPLFLRRFCMLWWFIEPLIESLAHPSRATHPMCLSLRQHSYIRYTRSEELTQEWGCNKNFAPLYTYMHQMFPHVLRGGRLETEIESIWRSVDAKSLARKMSVQIWELDTMETTGAQVPYPTWDTGSVGFHGFCEGALPENTRPHNDGRTSTIEFRTLESTLDPLLIIHWLAVLVRLFDFSRRAPPSDILAIICQSTSDYTAMELLRNLGLEEQVYYFSDKKVSDRFSNSESKENSFVPPYSSQDIPAIRING
ncbi:hypothetical protein F5B20DRAFT_498033 [Whalleya microplaca]|nr:hypothetical protein F5B20DRAFT_498033 [Whalleya microplaca]